MINRRPDFNHIVQMSKKENESIIPPKQEKEIDKGALLTSERKTSKLKPKLKCSNNIEGELESELVDKQVTSNSGLNHTSKREKTFEPSMEQRNFPKRDPRPPKKPQRVKETSIRFTNYLKQDYYDCIQTLRENGEVESMTAILNDAVHEYLTSYFPDKIK